ncbi:PEBP-like protein [Aaosphaeria arxii CBS 175.79]|uniref:Large ribosomal subunit protein mL38 n=1 Tax=Aaosphaeria arxii CBS 175.79 TaxID=1450172 RepID=A0A6A5XPL7_9PLEO|nr:PEBP-like protein [Aaosphaeria arxii CBS 175.79]KAF2014849.1 PEBP-like protein [Aaosphaeria arxii CBS 175.79]
MVSVKPALWQLNACLRCVRPVTTTNGLHGSTTRLFSISASTQDQKEIIRDANAPPPLSSTPVPSTTASQNSKPEFMQQWGTLDPKLVENKRDERRLIRREGIQPVGSRRRRAALRRSNINKTPEIPFEQLPYQCFQEARKILLDDRREKLEQIQTQSLRISNLLSQDPSVSGGAQAKEARLRSMRNRLEELIILADINDPIVKKKFEDGQGDMNKPIYRYLADQKWRKYKRLVLEQRLTQFNIVPDLVPALVPTADVDIAFGRKTIAPGEYVDSITSESLPRLNVQSFEPGEKLITVVVVDADVPVADKDGFSYRCHFAAANIPISPTQTSVPFTRIQHQDNKITDEAARSIALPWVAPWAHKGAPYHRLVVFVLEQNEAKPVDTQSIAKTKRDGFILRSFIDRFQLKPIGATLFRTKWDENMAGVMQRAGLDDQINIEFKRKRVEPLPYKKRTERMR